MAVYTSPGPLGHRARNRAERRNGELLRDDMIGTEGHAILNGDGGKKGGYRPDELYMDDDKEF